jgi:hypothetical protein
VDVSGPIIEAVRPSGRVVDGVALVLLLPPGAGAFYGVTDRRTWPGWTNASPPIRGAASSSASTCAVTDALLEVAVAPL